MIRRWTVFWVLVSLLVGGLSGCNRAGGREELTISGFAFDTTYTITLYQGGNQELLDSCIEKCSSYEKIFSRTLKTSEVYQINEISSFYLGKTAKKSVGKTDISTTEYEILPDGSISFQISDTLRDILKTGLAYAEASEGKFDITLEPVTSLWNFKAEKAQVPRKELITAALEHTGYQKVSLTGNTLTFSEPGIGIDLGGIAKGFIADELKAYLIENGVTGAIINLGGNILCIGGKSEDTPFCIGIQQPFADRNETIAAVNVSDVSVVSSGIYERYFQTDDGKLYHHIINPQTGYSYENDLLGVTIISDKSADGDALSTTCFALGRKKGLEYVDSLENVYAVFVTKDEKMWYSQGFQGFLADT